ncbi:hypothetical protein [Neorhizobium galegae]|uniref:hypothetical protein n=1 Tax=Neorhizobium galegae TaxID=399 RepID=UPI0021044053|nr:hypothetical protein [Neorhizobium galegae]MCQ1850269.1 hypothetical protein [Neorhizobium galegae]
MARDFFKRHMRHTLRTQAIPELAAGSSIQDLLLLRNRPGILDIKPSFGNVKAVSLGQADWLKVARQSEEYEN